MILRKQGILKSVRGHTGGYSLALPPEEIPVGLVMNALGGRLYDGEFCERHAGAHAICTHAVDCSVRSLWQLIQDSVDSVVNRVTIADLLAEGASSNVRFFDSPQRGTALL